MKKIIYINILSIFLLLACSKKEKTIHTEEKEHKDEIVLTSEQIKMNGIKYGKSELNYIESKILVTGIIHALPQNKSTVHPQIDGFIDKINFFTGDYVKKGQVMATLKNPSFITLQKQFLESYFNMNLNLKDFQRKKSLLKADAISKKAYEQAQAAYEVSTAEYQSLKSELQLLGFNPQYIQKVCKINPVLPIISPRSGFVQAKEISSGKQVTTVDELFEIINQNELQIELNVPVQYASELYIGQDVEFRLPEIQSKIKGNIHLIGKVTNTENNTVQIHVNINNKLPSNNFYEGRFVNAEIIRKTKEVSTLPIEAVFEEEGKKYIFIKKANNKVEKKEIQTGVSNDKWIEVINLSNNQEVVTSGVYYLKSGEMETGHNH